MILSFIQEIDKQPEPEKDAELSMHEDSSSGKTSQLSNTGSAAEKIDYSFDSTFESKYIHFKEKIEKDRLAWETLTGKK